MYVFLSVRTDRIQKMLNRRISEVLQGSFLWSGGCGLEWLWKDDGRTRGKCWISTFFSLAQRNRYSLYGYLGINREQIKFSQLAEYSYPPCTRDLQGKDTCKMRTQRHPPLPSPPKRRPTQKTQKKDQPATIDCHNCQLLIANSQNSNVRKN